MDKKVYCTVKKELDLITSDDLSYANGVLATKIAKGKKVTADVIRRVLICNVEDEFITYQQAVNVRNVYESYFGVVA